MTMAPDAKIDAVTAYGWLLIQRLRDMAASAEQKIKGQLLPLDRPLDEALVEEIAVHNDNLSRAINSYQRAVEDAYGIKDKR